MAHIVRPSDNIEYEPLPLTNDNGEITLHEGLPSRNSSRSPSPSPSPPGAGSQTFHTPFEQPGDLPGPSSSPPGSLPLGAGQPRFLGPALLQESTPGIRDSYASSHDAFPSNNSDYDSSVYALNNAGRTGSYAGTYKDDPRMSGYYAGSPGGEGVPMSPVGRSRYLEEKRNTYAPSRTQSKRRLVILGVIAALILLILAVVIPIYFAVIKKGGSSGLSSDGSSTANPTSTSSPAALAAVTGGDGSKVTMDDGSTFTYTNSFGGTWYWDENDPFNNGAQAQSWTPALNETFKYGVDKIRGVNLGGWLNTEPFIVPALYQKYVNNTTPAVDEWTLSENMAADTAGGGLNQLEDHYKTFITEKDFAEIAAAGLNFVRIPLPYWAIETRDNEPFLAKTSWTYFLKAIKWARKYGIRISLDLHALPGSQNGWNHSGKLGSIGVLNGPMGIANAQRSLDYIRVLAEFISQPEYKDVIPLFGVTNEPQGNTVGQDVLSSYYLAAYSQVREASGIGAGNGPYVSFHDGFMSLTSWANFLPNADRVSLDTHPYICFGGQSDAAMSTYATRPCDTWGSSLNTSMAAFGFTTAGEWSNAVTDCGLYVNGVTDGVRYEGTYTAGSFPRVGSCDTWTDWQNYDQAMKDGLKTFAMASMDALQNWFFWTWKIGNSSITGKVESPAWSYQLGLENGWMPKDPRSAYGQCGNKNPWSGPLKSYQTGGSGAGNIPASVSSSLAWPPATLSNGGPVSALPTYTPTGTVVTLPGPTFTNSKSQTISAGSGWQNSGDTAGFMTPVATCSYLDPWVAASVSPPSPLCSGSSKREQARRVPAAVITPPPH